MNKGLGLRTNFLTENEGRKFKNSNNPLFNERDWEDLMLNRPQSDVDAYFNLIEQYDKLDVDSLKNDWYFDDMSFDQKILKLSSDLGYVDDEKINTYDVVTGVDTQGNDIVEKQQMTEKQYYDMLLNDWVNYRKEQELLEERRLAKENKSDWDKFWNSVGSTIAHIGLGAVETVENVINFMDAGVDWLTELVNPVNGFKGNWREAMNTFRDEISDDYILPGFVEVTDDARRALTEWEADNTYFVNVDGNYTTVGKIVTGVADSIGQQIPSMLIGGPLATPLFYASIFESNVQESVRKYGDNPSISTEFIIGESLLETSLEFGIEYGLGKLFGITGSDLLRGVSGSGKTSQGIARVLLDAGQEGLEEVLQDFSSWGAANLAGLIHDEYRTDITWDQAWDAFVIGAVSSIVTGGFFELRNTVYDNKLSKELVKNDRSYALLKEPGKKGESKDQRRYRQGLLKATKASVEINKNKGFKFNRKVDKSHGLAGLINGYTEAADGVDLSTRKGQLYMAKLNQQLYIGYKTIMDIYGDYGTERMVAAEKLLNELHDYEYEHETVDAKYLEKSHKFSETLSNELNLVGLKYLVDKRAKVAAASKKVDEKITKNNTKKSATKSTKKSPKVDKDSINKLNKIVDSESENLNEQDKAVKSKIDTLENVYDHTFVPWDNWEIEEHDGVIFAPIDALQNLSPEELIKSAAERTLIENYIDVIPADVLNHFVTEFKRFIGKVNGDVEFKAITALLYNSDFYNYLLNNSDVEAFNVLKSVDKTLKAIVEENKNSHMTRQYNIAAKKIRSVMGPPLVMYFCNNPNARLENVTIFEQSHIDFINKHRYSYLVARRIINEEATVEEIRTVINRIQQTTLSQDTKLKYYSIIQSGNRYDKERVLLELDAFYEGLYFGKYNNIIYLKNTDNASARFNAFLMHMNVNAIDVMSNRIPERIMSQIADTDTNNYYHEQFRLFTNNYYDFEVTNSDAENPITIIELKDIEVSQSDILRNFDNAYDGRYPLSENLDISKHILDILNEDISKSELSYVTLNDILTYPEKYLSKQSIDEIIDSYEVLNKHTAFLFVNDFITDVSNNEVSLIVDSNNQVFAVDFSSAVDIVSTPLKNKFNREYDIYDDLVNKDSVTIDYFVNNKLLESSALKNIAVIISKDKSKGAAGEYRPDSNRIILHIGDKCSNNQIIGTMLHEFNHAVQYHNNYGHGGNMFTLSDDIVNDIIKHVPKLVENVSEDYKYSTVVSWVYSNATGEALSRGIYPSLYGFYPVVISYKRNVDENNKIQKSTQITLPWGKTYNITSEPVIKTRNREINDLIEKIKRDTVSLDDTEHREFSNPPTFRTLDENEKVKSKETLEQRYNKATDYQKRVNDALELAKSIRDENKKVYKKDLSQFKLPSDVVTKIVKNEYTKSNDDTYVEYGKVINAYKRRVSQTKHKTVYSEGKSSNRSRTISAKKATGTNLQYWIDKYPDKRPELYPAVQEFVINATDFEQLDNYFVTKIKNAELTLRDVYDYIRDAESIDDYTFNELKNAFFKNTPFNTFEEVKSFVPLVETAYGLKAGLLSIGQEQFVDKTLKWKLEDYAKKFEQMREVDAVTKIVNDALLRFNTFWEIDADGKRIKHEINMSDAESDVILGLLKYFDKTIDSLAYIAGNAKYALQRSVTNDQPFTYKQKKDAAGHNTLSIDSQLKGKKDTESSHTLADIIEDERQRLSFNSAEENRKEIINIAKDYVRTLINKGDIERATRIGKTIAQNIRKMNDDEVEFRLAVLNAMDDTGMTFDEAFDLDMDNLVEAVLEPETEIDVVIRRDNIYNSLKGIVNRLAENHISGNVYKNLPDDFKIYFNPKNNYRFNPESVKGLTSSQIVTVRDSVKKFGKRVRTGEFLNAKSKQSAEKVRIENEHLREQLAKYKNVETDVSGKNKVVYTIQVDENLTIESNKPVPEKLKKLLNTTFYKQRESTKKFSRLQGEKYVQINQKEFFEQNADTLNSITGRDAEEILDFFETATISNRDYVPYDSLRVYILAHFVEQYELNNLNVDSIFVERCKAMLDGVVSNTSARTLSAWRSVMMKVDPDKVILKELSANYDIELTDKDVEELSKVLKKLGRVDKTLSANPNYFKAIVDELNQTMLDLERTIIEKLRKKADEGVKSLKIGGKIIKIKGKEIPVKGWKIIRKQLLKYQRAAMLSSPATAVRNKISNLILGGFNVKGHHIWGMNDLADWIGGSKLTSGVALAARFGKEKKLVENQYKLTGVKVSTQTADFVKHWLLDTGLLDLIGDGLSKYDSRTRNATSGDVRRQLEDMIVDNLKLKLRGQYTFRKHDGKIKTTRAKNWLGSKIYGDNQSDLVYEYGLLDNICNLVFKTQSDNGAVKRTALRYIGKLLESEKIDLSNGINSNVMQVIADAYTFAAWEYIHRNNFIAEFERSLEAKYPNIHFVMKSIIPFASSTWNWFLETLQLTPIALVANIRKLNNLERYVNKLDERRRIGDTSIPDSRFAEMIVRRNIGKGVIGSVLMCLGFALGAFGKIRIDKEDDKLKMIIGDKTWVDIGNIFGTSSILVGATLAQPSEKGFIDVLEDACNQQLEDSILTQFMNMFRYDNTPVDFLKSVPFSTAATFIPNVWKSAVKLTANHTVNYSKGTLGDLQYLAVQAIPFMEYALPKGIDPYTGEWELRYSVPVVHQLINLVGSPISFKTYDMSDLEIEFMSLGINKKALTGRYNDIGQVNEETLNLFYGKLNKSTLTECLDNKRRYKVKNETTEKYEEKFYKDMTDEQKKNVLNRITNQNAEYAKIYAWTKMGHKYYCSSSERLELINVGVTENVYVGKQGFVK